MSEVLNVTVGPTAAPVKCFGGTAIQGRSAVLARSDGAGVLYGIDFPDKADSDHYGVVYGDGSTVQWDNDALPCIDNANDVAALANTAAVTLGLVVLVNGTPILRVGNDETAGAGEFEYGGTSDTLTVGSTYAAGTKIEVIAGQTVVTQTAVSATDVEEKTAYEIMTAGTAAVQIFK